MTDRQPALQVTRLTKAIAGREILTRCDLATRAGEICAIIGPNGAGKTTLFKVITGLTFPTSGSVTVLGLPLDDATRDGILSRVGATIEAPEFRQGATAMEVLDLHFDLLGIAPHSTVKQLLTEVGLSGAANSPVASFSLGMRQRLALARAIGHRPGLLVLDEPTNGLDPSGIADLRSILANLAAEGVAILIASHILTELENTAHTVAVLSAGRIGAKQELASVLHRHREGLEGFYRESVAEGIR